MLATNATGPIDHVAPAGCTHYVLTDEDELGQTSSYTSDTVTVDDDNDNDGHRFLEHQDCDDSNSSIHFGAPDLADGLDNDCDLTFDEDDADEDTYLVAPHGNDCDDSNAAINPAATEVPGNGVDEDCDPQAGD